MYKSRITSAPVLPWSDIACLPPSSSLSSQALLISHKEASVSGFRIGLFLSDTFGAVGILQTLLR